MPGVSGCSGGTALARGEPGGPSCLVWAWGSGEGRSSDAASGPK